MSISRRTVLKQMIFTSAGLMLIPSCMEEKSKASILVKNFTISTDQEAMLAELCGKYHSKNNYPGCKRYLCPSFCAEDDG